MILSRISNVPAFCYFHTFDFCYLSAIPKAGSKLVIPNYHLFGMAKPTCLDRNADMQAFLGRNTEKKRRIRK